MKRTFLYYLVSCIICSIFSLAACAQQTKTSALQTDKNNAELKLPAGFGALIVADTVGTARHIAVNSNGDIYVKLNRPKGGKGIVVLRDGNGD